MLDRGAFLDSLDATPQKPLSSHGAARDEEQ
jgi:hypothetical protein